MSVNFFFKAAENTEMLQVDDLIRESFVWFQQVMSFGGFTHLFPK